MMGAIQGPPKKHPHAASRVYEGEAFIVLPQYHEYKILNAVGTRIWDLIDGVNTAGDIARIVAEEYDVTYEEALKDVSSFLADLEANGMLASAKPS